MGDEPAVKAEPGQASGAKDSGKEKEGQGGADKSASKDNKRKSEPSKNEVRAPGKPA